MTGILLVSKGPLAKGMYESVKEEYFKDPQQFDYLIYSDSYRKDLMKKINELNDGHGVIILSDMMGEAPSNYASLLLDKGVHMVSGMNLSMVLYLLKNRENGIDFDVITQAGKDGIVHMNQILVLEPDVRYES